MNEHILYLNKPGHNFESGSPIGNGSMGAMLLCDPHHETIWLGEESIWNGHSRNTTSKEFKAGIEKLRDMYREGRITEIEDAAEELLKPGISRISSVEYAGKIEIDFETKGEIKDYKRTLHLNEGLLSVGYMNDNSYTTLDAFSSYSYEVTVLHYTFGRESAFDLKYSRENMDKIYYKNGILQAVSHTQDGLHHFSVGIKIETDGTLDRIDDTLSVDEATFATVYIAICTEFNFGDRYEKMCSEMLTDAEDYELIREQAIDDFSEQFEASGIDFESDEAVLCLPVDERLKRLRDDENARDDALLSVYFDFGKYLLLSSSRDTTLPAHLQGVWVEKIENPWNADYHTNINIQMNYWLSEVSNLSSTHMQLIDYMNKYLLESGKKTAREDYGCRGTVTHHVADIYGFTSPADGLWGVWPMGGAWLSYHAWEHYLYTNSRDYLEDDGYEYIRQCALFLIDYMFEDNGYLMTGPSDSPENAFYPVKGSEQECKSCFSPTMDVEITWGVLNHFIEADTILNLHPDEREEARRALEKLPPLKIGSDGRLLEWFCEYDEPEPGHRHISHAFGLYPGDMITRDTPEFYDAIRKTIEYRLSHGGGHTGWSRAWIVNMFARLHDGEKAYSHLRALLTKSTNDCMLDIHPPFQIDGNFGGAAGIAETLIQSHEGFISILPAVRKGLTGSFYGLRARGNFEVSAEFEDGKLLSFSIETPDEDITSVLVELPEVYECDLPREGNLYRYNLK